jgi:VanZ family protein
MTEHSGGRPTGVAPLLAWAPAVAWAALIFAFSAQPDLRFLPDQGIDFVVRKIGHAGAFGVFALLAWHALAVTSTLRRPWIWAIALTVVYAITDELHQGAVGRHASAVDVVVDAIGAILAVSAVHALRPRWGRLRGWDSLWR